METANTQMGEVIEGKEMTDVPLVSRSYTDLLSLQPGVVSTASGMTGAYAGCLYFCRVRNAIGLRVTKIPAASP